MAFATLFTLMDDIAAVMDDVALMTKMAAKKTAGVVGDDLALNANQVAGVRADRELPIVWAVAKGSLLNKAVLIPAALLLAVFAPFLITPLLLCGGTYLCFEGAEKLLHHFRHKKNPAEKSPARIAVTPQEEKNKVRGAIRTDFILSAEIIIIALGEVQNASLTVKILALSAIGIGITVFVYGVVAVIVKADDIGRVLSQQAGAFKQWLGNVILFVMPHFMRLLSIIGTIAMFLVGGSIYRHNIGAVHHWWENIGIGGLLGDFATGIIVGALACALLLPLVQLWEKLRNNNADAA